MASPRRVLSRYHMTVSSGCPRPPAAVLPSGDQRAHLLRLDQFELQSAPGPRDHCRVAPRVVKQGDEELPELERAPPLVHSARVAVPTDRHPRRRVAVPTDGHPPGRVARQLLLDANLCDPETTRLLLVTPRRPKGWRRGYCWWHHDALKGGAGVIAGDTATP